MTYQTTLTTKGQITIPKKFRDMLKLNKFRKVEVEMQKNKQAVVIKPTLDFLEVARRIKVRKKIDVLKAREMLEKNYERV